VSLGPELWRTKGNKLIRKEMLRLVGKTNAHERVGNEDTDSRIDGTGLCDGARLFGQYTELTLAKEVQ